MIAARKDCALNEDEVAGLIGRVALGDRMAFALSAYNGGMGWTNRDRNLATRRGLDPDRYFGSVETVNAGRRASAKRENQRYVSFIFERQAAYVKAGWGPGVRCE